MRQLRVTDEARADLTEIWLYVAQDNEDAANDLTDRIAKTFEQLLTVPGMGRERNDCPRTSQFSCRKVSHLLPTH